MFLKTKYKGGCIKDIIDKIVIITMSRLYKISLQFFYIKNVDSSEALFYNYFTTYFLVFCFSITVSRKRIQSITSTQLDGKG